MTTLAPTAPAIKVNGTALATAWQDQLTGVRVERAMGVVGRATLRFADAGYALSATNTFTLGADVEIGLHDGTVLMSGVVTGVSLEQSRNEQPEYVLVVDDHGFRLARGTTSRTFLQVSYLDALRTVITEAGMRLDASVGGLPKMPYLLQSGHLLSFVEGISERIGAVWWVEGVTLKIRRLGDGEGQVDLSLPDDMTEFSVQASGLRPSQAKVSGWDPVQQQLITGTANSVQPTAGGADFVSKFLNSKSPLGASAAAVADRNPLSLTEAQQAATGLLARWVADAVVARGTCWVDGRIKPGVVVAVSKAGPTSGNYLVTKVEHTYGRNGFRTRFTAGPPRPTSLVDTLGRQRPDDGFAIGGLVVGIVTNINDPDAAGRVQIRYPGLADEVGSPWARVMTLGAGSRRGVVFQPEVNDEVLVGFEHGDARRPIVLGGLFSKKQGLPDWGVKNGTVTARRLTSKLGHVIELADGDDPASQHLLLSLAGQKHKLRLGADRFDLEMQSGKPISIKSGEASFVIDARGNITIQGQAISIKAKQAVTVEGLEVSMKGQTKATVQGAQVVVKGEGTASVDGGGMLTLKGGMVAIN